MAPIDTAVILATRLVLESGNRLSETTVASIRRSLESLAALGVRNVTVVDGRQSEELRERLRLADLPTLSVRVLANTSWKNLSGSALLLARDAVASSDRCLVMRGDRPLDVEGLALLARLSLEHPDVDAAICVAQGAGVSSDNVRDVRVKLAHQHDSDLRQVIAIGEDLEGADGVFTGHAIVNRKILETLTKLPNPMLEDGLAELVANGRVLAMTRAWIWDARRPLQVDDKVSALLATKRHDHYTLFNPGPVNTTATVKSALVHHDVCHRDATFSELMVSLTGKLRRIFRGTAHHSVFPITGSGTAAMEASLVSTVPPDRKILIVDNGAFGTRLVEIARVHEMGVVHLRYDWGQTVAVADVERALADNPDVAVVAMIHHETSVGLLNPVREIGALCRARDVLLIVDAVSSLGAEDLDVVRDNIDICYGSANKCLHAVSGASFVCVSPRVWPRIEKLKPRAYYLDLRRYQRYMDELAQTPFTPAVSVYFALDAACSEFLADGHAARFAMYRDRNRQLRQGLTALGMHPYTTTGIESNSIVTCQLPAGIEFTELYDTLKARGIIVYGCKGVLAERYLQIANMGDLGAQGISQFLDVLGDVIAELRGESYIPETTVETRASSRFIA
ncbi:MAG: aminotransferase class V-fold PLP-dependent enzyme [Kofleriaceae bacterium]